MFGHSYDTRAHDLEDDATLSKQNRCIILMAKYGVGQRIGRCFSLVMDERREHDQLVPWCKGGALPPPAILSRFLGAWAFVQRPGPQGILITSQHCRSPDLLGMRPGFLLGQSTDGLVVTPMCLSLPKGCVASTHAVWSSA